MQRKDKDVLTLSEMQDSLKYIIAQLQQGIAVDNKLFKKHFNSAITSLLSMLDQGALSQQQAAGMKIALSQLSQLDSKGMGKLVENDHIQGGPVQKMFQGLSNAMPQIYDSVCLQSLEDSIAKLQNFPTNKKEIKALQEQLVQNFTYVKSRALDNKDPLNAILFESGKAVVKGHIDEDFVRAVVSDRLKETVNYMLSLNNKPPKYAPSPLQQATAQHQAQQASSSPPPVQQNTVQYPPAPTSGSSGPQYQYSPSTVGAVNAALHQQGGLPPQQAAQQQRQQAQQMQQQAPAPVQKQQTAPTQQPHANGNVSITRLDSKNETTGVKDMTAIRITFSSTEEMKAFVDKIGQTQTTAFQKGINPTILKCPQEEKGDLSVLLPAKKDNNGNIAIYFENKDQEKAFIEVFNQVNGISNNPNPKFSTAYVPGGKLNKGYDKVDVPFTLPQVSKPGMSGS